VAECPKNCEQCAGDDHALLCSDKDGSLLAGDGFSVDGVDMGDGQGFFAIPYRIMRPGEAANFELGMVSGWGWERP
jgi:hypothetical protein